METPQTRPEHGHRRFQNHDRRRTRQATLIADGGQQGGEIENSLGVPHQPASNPSACRLLVCADAFPFELGDFFDEALHFLVIVHRLADTVYPGFGDAGLSRFAIMALSQIQRGVRFSVGATAVGLATLARTDRQSSPQEPAIMGQLGEPGTKAPLDVGQLGAIHLRYK